MIFLGLDPGIQRVGYCVLKVQGSKCDILDLGTWHLVSGSGPRPTIEFRLEKLYVHMCELLKKHPPDVVGIEKVVSFKNVSSAHVLSEARGVIRLALQQYRKSEHPLRIWELSPTAIKKLATGFGSSDKTGIFKAMMWRMPGLQSTLKKLPDQGYTHDALDALAIAWSAMTEERTQQRLEAGTRRRPMKIVSPEGNA